MEKSYLLGSRHGTGLQLILVVLATTTSRYPEQLLLVGTQSSCRPTKFSTAVGTCSCSTEVLKFG
jgi:hypothetical protein